MKILASVKFNSRKAYVLDTKPNFIFYRLNNIIYGTDGLFYICYKYERPSSMFKAFGGQKFSILLNTGETVECNGQWWDGGYDILQKELGVTLVHITYNTIDNLKNCYVYTGSAVNELKFEELLKESGELFYHDYHDYEKIIKYEDVWNKRWEVEKNLKNLINKLKKDKLVLISQAKKFSKIVKLFKNQKFINQ